MQNWIKNMIAFFRRLRKSDVGQAAIEVASKKHPEVGIANKVLNTIEEGRKEKWD